MSECPRQASPAVFSFLLLPLPIATTLPPHIRDSVRVSSSVLLSPSVSLFFPLDASRQYLAGRHAVRSAGTIKLYTRPINGPESRPLKLKSAARRCPPMNYSPGRAAVGAAPYATRCGDHLWFSYFVTLYTHPIRAPAVFARGLILAVPCHPLSPAAR